MSDRPQLRFISRVSLVLLTLAPAAASGPSAPATAPANPYFEIRVVDEQTGRGVPLVELTTTYHARYVTDSAGRIAFYEPGLMDQEVHFAVRSHGYAYPSDGFGISGLRLVPTAGGSATVTIRRLNLAERLYRLTGAGIYRDSILLGRPVPLAAPVLNGRVTGCDSVLTALYRSRLFWIWGDTNWPAYPLGNFHATGATSRLPRDGGLDPDLGIDFTYFVREDGFARQMAPRVEEGAVWLDALTVFNEPQNGAAGNSPAATTATAVPGAASAADGPRERLLAAFARVRGLEATLERGFVEFDDEKQHFERVASFPLDAPVCPAGHPFRVRVGETPHLYFATAFPLRRVRDERAAYLDVSQCEAFTCLVPGTRLEAAAIDRGPDGAVRWGWKRNTPPLGPKDEADLVQSGKLQPGEALLQTRDIETGQPVWMHGGSTCWNAYRGRWVMIATQIFGTSMLGELWYCEADTPTGPWVYARKVLTHDNYSFYNPRQHPQFAKEGGRIIYFEGTYTVLFSGNEHPTPFYEYNQIMYRLDLGDDRLVLPVPVYAVGGRHSADRLATRGALRTVAIAAPDGARASAIAEARGPGPIAFFACDRPRDGLVPIVCEGDGSVPVLRALPADRARAPSGGTVPDATRVVCYALPPDVTPPPPCTVALHEYRRADGSDRWYGVDTAAAPPGFERQPAPLCHVWQNPYAPTMLFDPAAEVSAEPW